VITQHACNAQQREYNNRQHLCGKGNPKNINVCTMKNKVIYD
jgi:hypothetical protein